MNSKYKTKANKNIDIEKNKFRVNLVKNYIKKNIGEYNKYFKGQCDKQDRRDRHAERTLQAGLGVYGLVWACMGATQWRRTVYSGECIFGWSCLSGYMCSSWHWEGCLL